MPEKNIKKVFSQFDVSSNMVSYKELASGHINNTYLINTNNELNYVLQRINHSVFKDIPGLISNKVLVSKL